MLDVNHVVHVSIIIQPALKFYFEKLSLFQIPYYWPSNNSEPENTDYGKTGFFKC